MTKNDSNPNGLPGLFFRGLGIKVPPPPDNASVPGLFTAIQEQLGLKLDATKASIEVFAIDRVEKPSEN